MSKSPSASPEFSVRQFFARFPDEQACLDHIMKVRFGGTLKLLGVALAAESLRL